MIMIIYDVHYYIISQDPYYMMCTISHDPYYMMCMISHDPYYMMCMISHDPYAWYHMITIWWFHFQYKDFTIDPKGFQVDGVKEFISSLHKQGKRLGNVLHQLQ